MRKIKVIIVSIFFFGSLFLFAGKFLLRDAGAQSSLSAPTRVTASDGVYATKTGIIWDAIRGASVYRIYRNTINDPNSAADIGTTAAASFYDTTAIQGQNYFYWVKAENGAIVSPFSSPDQGLRASGIFNGGIFPPLDPPASPPGNSVTAAKATLGKVLFWDEQLSSTQTVSCGTCHIPASGGSDPRSRTAMARSTNPGFDNVFGTLDDVTGSIGVPLNNADGTYGLSNLFGMAEQVTGRKANPFIDAAYGPSIFWDGRAGDQFRDPVTNTVVLASGAALESQAAGPPLSAVEMAHQGRNWTQTAAQISASRPLALSPSMPQPLKAWIGGRSYPQLFQEAFGSPDVTPSKIAMAIATYERSLFSDQTPLDKDSMQIEPLTAQEELGRGIFIAVQCSSCHDGALLTDTRFHNIGVRPTNEDTGRFAVTSDAVDLGAFKTPGLRNVELRGPYMHNGRFNTLEEVVEFYNRGGDFDAPNINRELIRPLGMNADQKAALVAFLKRPLSDPRVAMELPPFDRPALYTESSRVPLIIGNGVSGIGGQIPLAAAIEPPIIGNPSFTIGLSKSRAGANAVLVIDDNDPGTGPAIPSSGSFARVAIQLQGSGANGYGSVSIAIPNNAALVNRTFTARWFINDPDAANGVAVSRAFRFTVFADDAFIARRPTTDFDGDGKSDISIFRPSVGEWYYLSSQNGNSPGAQFGASTDKIAPADFTGDGKADFAFFRPSDGNWYIIRSENQTFFAFPFGANGDIPAPGDFDGDGKADVAIYRPSSGLWAIRRTSDNGTTIEQFGASTDFPVVADYDGDGKADISVYRPGAGEWYTKRSSTGAVFGAPFGAVGDKPIQGDYTGDGKADFAVFRPSTGFWYVLRSEDQSFFGSPFGVSTDTPTIGDYDGDGKNDFAVFRPSTGNWFIQRSTAGFLAATFGVATDRPAPAYYLP